MVSLGEQIILSLDLLLVSSQRISIELCTLQRKLMQGQCLSTHTIKQMLLLHSGDSNNLVLEKIWVNNLTLFCN
jgi:hypothetical protein